MCGNSLLAIKIGKVIGTGPGRGTALLILLAGILLAIIGIIVSKLKSIKKLEEENENETIAEYCQEGF
ncbi:MAG: hypothetical protein WBH44_04280 [Proteocatella sp.]